MPWKRKDQSEYRDCAVCSETFSREERSYAAVTCSPKCGLMLEKRRAAAYAKSHLSAGRASAARYKERNRERQREYARQRRAKLKEARHAQWQ